MIKKSFVCLGLLLASVSMLRAGTVLKDVDYEFTNYVETSDCKFRMWVPPTCQSVRGVLLAFNQMQEIVSLDQAVREACLIEDLAIVWANNIKDFSTVDAGLKALAEASGMPEIATAPFATIGHSTAGIWCRTLALEKPERCFGIIQMNAVDYAENEKLKDIPWITIKNGAEETDDTWLQARDYIINGKADSWTSPRENGCHMALISLIGGGHFGWSPFESKLVAAFIQKAAHYQIAKGGQEITRIPEDKGWLTDTATVSEPQYEPASYEDYQGDKTKAFWHMDEEYAKMWLQMHQEEAAKQAQTITLSTFDTSVWQPSKNMDLSQGGVTTPYAYDAVSSVSGNPIKVKGYYGVYRIENGNELYFSPARYKYISDKDWLTFYQEGTETERYAEISTGRVSVSNMPAGEELSLTEIADQNISTKTIPYNVSGSDNIDDWVVSGPVVKSGTDWKINNYTSVPKLQVYIRHAAGNNNTLKETKFTITNDRPSQTLTFDSEVPVKVNANAVTPITLSATASGADAEISYHLLGGPAALEGNTLTPNGEIGVITVMAIARNEANNPAKAVLEISVEEYDESGFDLVDETVMSVYPNPVKDILSISAPAGTDVYVKDLTGRVVLETETTSALTEVSVESLPKGIYLLSLTDGKAVKIVKE